VLYPGWSSRFSLLHFAVAHFISILLLLPCFTLLSGLQVHPRLHGALALLFSSEDDDEEIAASQDGHA
jgi:hypothetical protein